MYKTIRSYFSKMCTISFFSQLRFTGYGLALRVSVHGLKIPHPQSILKLSCRQNFPKLFPQGYFEFANQLSNRQQRAFFDNNFLFSDQRFSKNFLGLGCHENHGNSNSANEFWSVFTNVCTCWPF